MIQQCVRVISVIIINYYYKYVTRARWIRSVQQHVREKHRFTRKWFTSVYCKNMKCVWKIKIFKTATTTVW